MVARRHAHRLRGARLHLPPRRRPADPPRDRSADGSGGAARDRRRRRERGQLRRRSGLQPGRHADRVRRTARSATVPADRRRERRCAHDARAAGPGAPSSLAWSPDGTQDRLRLGGLVDHGRSRERRRAAARRVDPRAQVLQLGGPRMVARRHPDSRRRRRRHRPGDARPAPSVAARDRRALRRVPVVLTRRDADRVRRARRGTRSAARPRSWSPTPTAPASARSAPCRSGRACDPTWQPADRRNGGVAAGSGCRPPRGRAASLADECRRGVEGESTRKAVPARRERGVRRARVCSSRARRGV